MECCTDEFAWLLENEFDVSAEELQEILDECVKDFFEGCSYADEDVWGGVASVYLNSSAGYYALCGSRYELAQISPGTLVDIKNSFPNVDSEQLLRAAGAVD